MAPSLNSKEDEGGDDLGTTDEVRVFKDEGDFEEEDACENLHADLFEEEAGFGTEPGSSKVQGGKAEVDPAAAFKNPLAMGYPHPYLAGGYPRPYLLDPLGPPPAHMSHPLAAAASALRPPSLYPPMPQYNPYGGLDQLAAWHHLYGQRPPAPGPFGMPPFGFPPSPQSLAGAGGEGYLPPGFPGVKHEDMPGLRPAEDKENIAQKKENHIKKPLNAFMLYMREMRPIVQAECTLKESAAINQILGRRWHGLSRDEQAKYYEKAREERHKHMQLYPNWNARDNYRYGQKKKRKRDKTDDPAANIKKCRARYGLEQQNLWCKPCRRKKKCIRVQMYLDGASEAEIDEQLDGIPRSEKENQDHDDAEATFESDGEEGSGISSDRSLQSPPVEMSIPSLASPGGSGYGEDHHSGGGGGGGIGYKNIQNGFRSVGADPRDSKNPLSISSLTASIGTREDGGGQTSDTRNQQAWTLPKPSTFQKSFE